MLDGKYLNAVNSSGVAESYPLWTTQDDSTGEHFLNYKKQASTTKSIVIGVQNSTVLKLVTDSSSYSGYYATQIKSVIITLSEKCPYTIIIGDYTVPSGDTSCTTVVSTFSDTYSVSINSIAKTTITPLDNTVVYKDDVLSSGKEDIALSTYGSTYTYTDDGVRYARLYTYATGSLETYTDDQLLYADISSESNTTVCSESDYTPSALCTSTSSYSGGCSVVACTDSSWNGSTGYVCNECYGGGFNNTVTDTMPTETTTETDTTEEGCSCDKTSETATTICSGDGYCPAHKTCDEYPGICANGLGCNKSNQNSNCFTCGCGGYGNDSGGCSSVACRNSGYNNPYFERDNIGTSTITIDDTTYIVTYDKETDTYETGVVVVDADGTTHIEYTDGKIDGIGDTAYEQAKQDSTTHASENATGESTSGSGY